MYNTVIFDLDGTLLNTLEDLADSVNYVQKKYGYQEDTIDTVRMHVGNGIRNLIKRSIPEGENNPDFNEIFRTFQQYYKKHCQDKTKPYPGIMEMLEELHRRGVKMAIVSNKADAAVKILNETYFKEYIEVAVGENEEAGIQKKPAPDEVHQALKLLGSIKDTTLYVGDSDVDKETADNSGLDCILCEWGFRDLELLESLNPKAIIEKPEDLVKLI